MTALGPDPVSLVTGLDHVGFIVVDLEAASRMLGQLGFRLTARADHTRTDASGRSVPAGSSQRSAMFRRGYVELMQITDPDAGRSGLAFSASSSASSNTFSKRLSIPTPDLAEIS